MPTLCPCILGDLRPRCSASIDLGKNTALDDGIGFLFPEWDATYLNYNGNHDSRHGFKATYQVPENKAFWSITVYGKDGFMKNDNNIVNSSNVKLNPERIAGPQSRMNQCRHAAPQFLQAPTYVGISCVACQRSHGVHSYAVAPDQANQANVTNRPCQFGAPTTAGIPSSGTAVRRGRT